MWCPPPKLTHFMRGSKSPKFASKPASTLRSSSTPCSQRQWKWSPSTGRGAPAAAASHAARVTPSRDPGRHGSYAGVVATDTSGFTRSPTDTPAARAIQPCRSSWRGELNTMWLTSGSSSVRSAARNAGANTWFSFPGISSCARRASKSPLAVAPSR